MFNERSPAAAKPPFPLLLLPPPPPSYWYFLAKTQSWQLTREHERGVPAGRPPFASLVGAVEPLRQAQKGRGLEAAAVVSMASRHPDTVAPQQQRGVAECYVFKSRLQEYAQKVGFLTPVYQTVKEGPSHEPIFKSTVIVNDVTYDSLPGFFNRKAAEQSAAEVALMKIHESGQMTEGIPTVHETGLCKNLLQEYAQKMNYAIPTYVCKKQPSGFNPFSCTVEIGGIQYIGAAARTKKEAEIKAARTALLAIQRTEMNSDGASQYSVLPGKKKATETQAEALKQLKPKKASFKRKWPKKRFPRKKDNQAGKNQDEVGIGKVEDVEANNDCQGQPQLEGSIRCESEPGLGDVKDEARTLDDTRISVELNGNCQDARQEGSGFGCTGPASYSVDGSTTLRASDESWRVKMMDSPFTEKGVEISAAGDMSGFKGEE